MTYSSDADLIEAMLASYEDGPFTPFEKDKFYIHSPDEVVLLTSGAAFPKYKIIRSRGMTDTLRIQADRVSCAFYLIDESMRKTAFKHRCNGVIGYERAMELWENPIRCWASGVFVVLEKNEGV